MVLGRPDFFLPPFLFSCLSRCFEFAVTFFEYLFFAAFQFNFGGHVAQRAVQSLVIVVANIVCHLCSGLFKRQWDFWADTFLLDGAVETLQFAIALRIVRRCPYVGHACHPDKLFEVLGDKLRAVVGNDPRGGGGMLFPGSLEDDFHICFSELLALQPSERSGDYDSTPQGPL